MKQRQAGHEFTNVDQTADPTAFVHYLDERGALAFFHLVERQMTTQLTPRAGGHYLDVGCGTGDDVRSLAELVGSAGHAIGIDSSQVMIAEAQKRSMGSALPAEFRVGDAHHLDFADASFDGCRTRRVLQHLEDPAQAVVEMARVTRSGGRVVAYEPDWETLVLDAPERTVTRAVLQLRCDAIRNGWMGRQLFGVFKRADLQQITVEPMTSTLGDAARAVALFELETYLQKAQAAGLVTAVAASTWLERLAQAGRAGTFFAAITGFLVSGQKR